MERKSKRKLVAVWRGRIAGQRRSGLSIAGYCRREGFSEPSFYLWRKRLRGKPSILRAPVTKETGRAPRGAAGSALFVPITLANSASSVRLELPGGAVLTLPSDASAELAAAAIGAALGPAAVRASATERPSC